MKGVENMKTMIAYGIPPSGKNTQILRRSIMPEGDECELVKQYADFIAEIIGAKNVHVVVKDVGLV